MVEMTPNPSMYVDKYYVMDPSTDVMLFDGTELKVGMHVLAGAESLRANPQDLLKTDDTPGMEGAPPFLIGILTMTGQGNNDKRALIDRLDEVNRWCEVIRVNLVTVGEVQHSDHTHHAVSYVEFIGQYADGTQRKRSYPVQAPWLVRKFSLPDAETVEVPDTIAGL